MLDPTWNKIAALAFDILLDQLDPRSSTLDAAIHEARQLCGRWLAFHRLRRHMTVDMVAHRTRIEPYQLLLLETGLANATLVPEESWYQLCLMLQDERHPLDCIAAVLHSALGLATTPCEQLLEQVAVELANSVQRAELFQGPVMQPDLAPGLQPVSYVLVALQDTARDGGAIQKHIEARSGGMLRVGPVMIHAILATLAKDNFVLAFQPETAPDHERRTHYRLTPEGARIARVADDAIRLEEQRRGLDEQRQRLDEQRRRWEEEQKRVAKELAPVLNAVAASLP